MTGFLPVACLNPQADQGKDMAAKIHAELFTVDSHTDTPFWLFDPDFRLEGGNDPDKINNRVDLQKMAAGGLDGVFFAAFVSQQERTPDGNARAIARVHEVIDTIVSKVGRTDGRAVITTTPGQAYRQSEKGIASIFIGIENGYGIGNDTSMIREYFRHGVRYITLCHSLNNDICDASTDDKGPEHGGLSPFGTEVVEVMNRTGMMIDISHASDESFFDVIEASSVPLIASHSSARALCDNPRNMSDTMIIVLAEHGGVIQVCLLSAYVRPMAPNPARDSARADWWSKYPDYDSLSLQDQKLANREWRELDQKFPPNLATVSDLADHIDHIVKIAGIDHVGIGSDFDGGGGLADCRGADEMANITRELLRRGYTQEDLKALWGGNLMRVMQQALDAAASPAVH